jgi:hypothetical protein
MKTSFTNRDSLSLAAVRTPGKGLFAAYCGISLFAILYIPYFVPVPPSTADSYIFGYNNRAGIVLFLLLVSIGAIWTRGFHLAFATTQTISKIPRKNIWLSLAVESAACAAMYFGVCRFKPIGESAYEINRAWLVSLGKIPYVDFEWTYGSAILYIPAWISRLFHVTIPQGYALFWAMASLGTIVLIYLTINLIDFPCKHKTFLFYLFNFCALLEVPNFCAAYTLQRYFFPLFFILVIYNVSRQHSRLAPIRAGATAVAFTVILIFIAPEMAIAHAFACVLLLLPPSSAWVQVKQLAAYLVTVVLLGLLFIVGVRIHVLDGVRSAGQGISSLPITFAPATLMFFCAVYICACYVVRRATHRAMHDNTIALIACAFPMTAAALGRCDPGHILTSGIGFFIAAFFYASTSPRVWKAYRAGFLALVLLPCSLLMFLGLAGTFKTYALPVFPATANPHSLYAGEVPSGDGLLETPFSYEPAARDFYYSTQIDYGYFDGNADLATPAAIQRKIDELRQHPQRSLLLESRILEFCDADQENRRIYLSFLLFSPYTAKAVHHRTILVPLCDYIRAHYALAVPGSPENFNYALWSPTP